MPTRSTPSENARRHLLDILDSLVRVERFVGTYDFAAFAQDDKTAFAVVRCLEIISEASRRLPGDVKARHPSIDWGAMAGAGNVYRHDYEIVELSYVWRTVQDDLPPLRHMVDEELRRTDERE